MRRYPTSPLTSREFTPGATAGQQRCLPFRGPGGAVNVPLKSDPQIHEALAHIREAKREMRIFRKLPYWAR